MTNYISIHATHTGGDKTFAWAGKKIYHFNPRHPYGWRLEFVIVVTKFFRISIHATHTGGDPAQHPLFH